MSQDVAREVMRRYLMEVVAGGRLELLDEIAAEGLIDHTAVAAGWGEGRAGLERHVRFFRDCIPDMEITIQRLIASDDEVAGIWRVKGTHSAALFGVPATGRVIEWTNVSVFRVVDGKIVDYTGVWGSLEAVQRMGVPIKLPAS